MTQKYLLDFCTQILFRQSVNYPLVRISLFKFVLVNYEENNLFNHFWCDNEICFRRTVIGKVESTLINRQSERNVFNYILSSLQLIKLSEIVFLFEIK